MQAGKTAHETVRECHENTPRQDTRRERARHQSNSIRHTEAGADPLVVARGSAAAPPLAPSDAGAPGV